MRNLARRLAELEQRRRRGCGVLIFWPDDAPPTYDGRPVTPAGAAQLQPLARCAIRVAYDDDEGREADAR